jgi:8-oxo-dGTP pyrophosphatase MutT (NUDIX family)
MNRFIERKDLKPMPMSEYYKQLRKKVGTDLIFSPGVAALIRNAEGYILFQLPQGNRDIWSLPAGSIEPGETPEEAVIREVWEETGLQVTPVRLAGAFGGKAFRHTYPDGNQVEYLVLVYECRIDGGTLQAIDGESAELRYFPPSARPPLALPYPEAIFLSRSTEANTPDNNIKPNIN